MRKGKSPQEAALQVLERIVAFAKDNRDKKGQPDFDITFYAVNKRGEYTGAAVWSATRRGRPARFAIADASGPRLVEAAYLLKREKP